jgi:hypothetical protein
MYGFFMNKFGVFLANIRGGGLKSENLQWGLEGWEALISNPSIYFLNRAGLSVLGSLTCLIVIAIGVQLLGRLSGLIGGLALAANPTMVSFDSSVGVSGISAFFFVTTIFLALKYYHDRQLQWILLAFATTGLAAGSKYQAGIAVIAPLIVMALTWSPKNTRKQLQLAIGGALIAALVFALTTPFALVRPNEFVQFLRMLRNIYYNEGMYGSVVEPGIAHLVAITSVFAERWSWPLLILSLIGVVSVLFVRPKDWLIAFVPSTVFTLYMSTSIVNRHFSHSITYPVLAMGVGAGVSLFVGLWLVGRQNRWRGASLLAVPMVAAFVPVGLAVGGGFQQIATDWRYQDPRVKAIDVLATGQHGGNILIATELRVHPAERERLSGVASAQVLPLERITQCDFSPDTTLLLPTSVTTWREAAARRIGEIKPANELNADLQRLVSNVTPSAQFGSNETVLDYNFTDPQLVIVKASDLTACA